MRLDRIRWLAQTVRLPSCLNLSVRRWRAYRADESPFHRDRLPAAQGMEVFDVKLDVDVLPLTALVNARFTTCALAQQHWPKPAQQDWETES